MAKNKQNRVPRSEIADAEAGEQTRAGRLVLRPDLSLAEGLATALADILAYARSQADTAESDTVTAVHEYRKSIRRARALVNLSRGLIGRRAFGDISAALRQAHRAMSARRDRDIVLNTLYTLGLEETIPKVVEAIRTMQDVAPDSDQVSIATVLAHGSGALEPLPRVFADALPERVKWRDITNGMYRSYRRTRRAMRGASLRNEYSIHEWRKCNKALVYQVEFLVTGLATGKDQKLRKQLAQLSEELGSIVDLMVLEKYVCIYATGDEFDRALASIHRAKKNRFKQARRRGARLVKQKPGRFAHKLIERIRKARKSAREELKRCGATRAETSPPTVAKSPGGDRLGSTTVQ